MGYYEPDIGYYEPSEADIFFDEMKEKLKEHLLDEIKYEIQQLKYENEKLKEQNKKYCDREYEINEKERDLKYKMEDYKQEVKKEFYQKNIVDVFEDFLDTSEVWYAANIGHEKPKCNLCNENREVVAKFPDGTTASKKCECNHLDYYYEPRVSENKMLKFHKSYGNRYEKKAYILKAYQPDKDTSEAYDCYSEFRIIKIYNDFNDEVIASHKEKTYGDNIGFNNKEACQQYCNWLNEEKDKYV